jgi:Uncharacterised protein family (UPF0175)
MKTITIAFPDDATLPFGSSDDPFAREHRLAAAIFWYDRGLISQAKGAEIAGLTGADFIDALGRANVSAIQTTVEELKSELVRPRHANQEGRELGQESFFGKREGWCPRLVGMPRDRGRSSLLPKVRARSPDPAPNEAPGLLPLSMILGHHPTVATLKIPVGRRLLQRHDGGGGNQSDPHVVKFR